MIKIRFNKQRSNNFKYDIKIVARTISIEVIKPNSDEIFKDVITNARQYNNYALVYAGGRNPYRYRDIQHRTSAIFYDVNKIGESIKDNLNTVLDYYNRNGILATVDTGIYKQDWRPSENRDIVITVLQGSPESTTIEADGEYVIEEFNISDATRDGFPRDQIWDSYALEYNGDKYIVDSHERNMQHRFTDETFLKAPGVIEYEGDGPITFTIRKCNTRYTPDHWLTRDIDDDEVFVESTAGLTNTKRVYLKNGVGTFKLYPLEYEGKAHIKLGRKWYSTHNDYVMTFVKKK